MLWKASESGALDSALTPSPHPSRSWSANLPGRAMLGNESQQEGANVVI